MLRSRRKSIRNKKHATITNSKPKEERVVNKGRYQAMKRVAKKTVAVAKNITYERLYKRFKTKEGEKETFKLARVRERRTRDLGNVRCIKDVEGKVLVEEVEIKKR